MAPAGDTAFDFGRTLLIGIGAQKAGTTWLARKLAAHPEVHAPIKEVHYWDRIRAPFHDAKRWRSAITNRRDRFVRNLPQRFWRKKWSTSLMVRPDPCDHSGYVDMFRWGYGGQPVLHEFTPAYGLLAPEVFNEMRALHADVRFLLLLRDPVARFWSGIRHAHRVQLANGMTEESLVHLARLALADPHDPHRRRSDYAALLSAPALGEGRMHVAFFETLFTQESYDAVLEFAGLARETIGAVENPNPSRFGKVAMPKDLAAQAREVFASSYEQVYDRFKDRVPARWGGA
ncbi:sulfotransferase [Roseibacterium beibuensis]|uniref:Sulfotransferase family protein n=1 Tax=[Roseibacterium] beibuensis TaxID=1193142 RepID=A0ABP9L9M2_9RHOB|nr:sulfotransferase [Roseibacterium beibuensis]MCS6624006.1 sulfotransferase [Roseibacterium beibuensis]